MAEYRTTPDQTVKMPGGVPFIIGNEFAERFSYYGMKAVLITFMTEYLRGSGGGLDVMDEETATGWAHTFNFLTYLTPFFGALLADAFLGKYKTIIGLSIVYCLGHLALALDETRLGLSVGLTLIAIGAGGIKPCVSAHVGDQFGSLNKGRLPRVFAWFYFSINIGALISQLLTPKLLVWFGPQIAFGVPGGLMLLATIVFWMGRNQFVHIPPRGQGYFKELFSRDSLRIIGRIASLYFIGIPIFWSLFDQGSTRWVLQAKSMDLNFLGITWENEQIQSVNAFFVLFFIPLFNYVVYPFLGRFFKVTPIRKIGIGLFITVFSFLVTAWIQWRIETGALPSIGWQVVAYAIITAAEVMISITALEFAYTQAPHSMKSFIMSFYLLAVALGNAFTAIVNFALAGLRDSFALGPVGYYVFFAVMMFLGAILFAIVARGYKEMSYIQGEQGQDG